MRLMLIRPSRKPTIVQAERALNALSDVSGESAVLCAPMPRLRRRLITVLVAIALMAAIVYVRDVTPEGAQPAASAPAQPGDLREVVRVVDGDTLLLDRVNTPESVDPRRPVERFGKEAAAFTRSLAEGKQVRLEFDHERRDTYGRTLAYVYLPDGSLLNETIIREGYGFAYTRFPYQRMERFRELERQAREQGRGLWAGEHR
jgi:endonuclease YncB( thermonuclease family)